jgi:hypothetical protein
MVKKKTAHNESRRAWEMIWNELRRAGFSGPQDWRTAPAKRMHFH